MKLVSVFHCLSVCLWQWWFSCVCGGITLQWIHVCCQSLHWTSFSELFVLCHPKKTFHFLQDINVVHTNTCTLWVSLNASVIGGAKSCHDRGLLFAQTKVTMLVCLSKPWQDSKGVTFAYLVLSHHLLTCVVLLLQIQVHNFHTDSGKAWHLWHLKMKMSHTWGLFNWN